MNGYDLQNETVEALGALHISGDTVPPEFFQHIKFAFGIPNNINPANLTINTAFQMMLVHMRLIRFMGEYLKLRDNIGFKNILLMINIMQKQV